MSRHAAILVLLAPGIAATFAQDSDHQQTFPLFVGRSVCVECHQPQPERSAPATPCTLRPIPEHNESYQLLEKPKARSIAALNGVVGPPPESRLCLYCHSTAADEGKRWTTDTFRADDGVQCEACHGAGSLHVKRYRDEHCPAGLDEPQHIRPGNQDDCKNCHVERASHVEVVERGFRLAAEDGQYKTPVDLVISPDGEWLYVVCEHSDSVIVIHRADMEVVREWPVGRRPRGVAVSPDGRRVYVTNRLSGTMSVIDVASGQAIKEVAVGHEPHGVWADPSGRRVWVVNTGDDSLSIINATTLTETRRLATGVGPWGIAVDAVGRRAYITNVRPAPGAFRAPPVSEVTVVDLNAGVVVSRPSVRGANMLQGVAWGPQADVGLFTLMRTKNLIPTSRIAQGWVITNGIGVVRPDGQVDQLLLDEPARSFPDPVGIAISPNGQHALVTSGGADEIAVIDVPSLLDVIGEYSGRERETVLPNHLGTSGRFVLKRLPVGSNPRAVAFSADGAFAYVVNALDDSLTVIDTTGYRVERTVSLGGPKRISQIRWGEKLFHSADITYAQQFSCRSCHPDGHINGLTFDIEADGIGLHPVDNRTLRGILDTAPFKWEGTNPSLHHQCGPRLAVFFTRLDPFSSDELDAVVRYMSTIEQTPNRFRRPDGLSFAQRSGKAVFERTRRNDGSALLPRQRCVHCHGSAHMTRRIKVPVSTTMWFDARVNVHPSALFNANEYGELGSYYFIDVGLPPKVLDVPQLRNIADSPPYLHNGAAKTLEEIWTRFNFTDRHGATSDLTRQQLNDLIAYLKSL